MKVLYLPNNWDNYIIFKNGFSTLGAVSYEYHTNIKLDKHENVHSNIWEKYIFRCRRPNTKLFIVYRDPFERFVSLYKDMVSGSTRHSDLNFLYNKDTKVIQLNFIKYFVFANGGNYDKDEHTKRITDLYDKNELNDVDLIVDIKDLSTFIKNELGMDHINRNVSKDNMDISMFMRYKNIICNYYKPDYDFYELNKHKFYKK